MNGPGADVFGLSQALWSDVPVDLLATKDRDIGWMLGDDFTNFAADAAVASSLGYYKSEGNCYKTFELKGSSDSTAIFIPDESPWTVPSATNVYTPNGQGILYPGGSVIPTPGVITITPAAASDNGGMVLAGNMARASATVSPGCFTPYPITTGGSTSGR